MIGHHPPTQNSRGLSPTIDGNNVDDNILISVTESDSP